MACARDSSSKIINLPEVREERIWFRAGGKRGETYMGEVDRTNEGSPARSAGEISYRVACARDSSSKITDLPEVREERMWHRAGGRRGEAHMSEVDHTNEGSTGGAAGARRSTQERASARRPFEASEIGARVRRAMSDDRNTSSDPRGLACVRLCASEARARGSLEGLPDETARATQFRVAEQPPLRARAREITARRRAARRRRNECRAESRLGQPTAATVGTGAARSAGRKI